MSQFCHNCRFSVNTGTEEKENFLCRRFPPQNVHAVENLWEQSHKPTMAKVIARGCPVAVNHNWWCGEWKSRGWW